MTVSRFQWAQVSTRVGSLLKGGKLWSRSVRTGACHLLALSVGCLLEFHSTAVAQSSETHGEYRRALGPYRIVYNLHGDGRLRLIPLPGNEAEGQQGAGPPLLSCTADNVPLFSGSTYVTGSVMNQDSSCRIYIGSSSSQITIGPTDNLTNGAWLRNNGSDTVLSTNVGNLYLGWSGNTAKTIYIGNGPGGVVEITGSAPTQSVVVNSSGDVGVGTNSPYGSLTVGSGGSAFTINASDVGTGAWLRNDGSNTVLSTNVGSLYLGYGGNTSKIIRIGNGPGAVQVAGNAPVGTLVIASTTGNVGIGTTSPSAPLEVNGAAKFDSAVSFTSGQTFPNTISSITTPSSGGLTGGGSSSSLTLSLLTSCSNGQILQWNSTTSTWACTTVSGTGTITGVTAGTDLTGGGTAGVVTLNVDTTKVPQLATANTFTNSQTVQGNVTMQGPSPWIDVTAYGADPNGAGDSTAAINNAIGACPTSPAAGCTVFFPPGVYLIGSTANSGITINHQGVRLVGVGMVAAAGTNPAAASVIADGSTTMLTTSPMVSVASGVNGFGISNLGFHDASNKLAAAAVLLQEDQYFEFDNISCIGFNKGSCIQLQGNTTPTYTQFGTITNLFTEGSLNGINAGPSVSEVTILGGNISCLDGNSTYLPNSIGVNFTSGSGSTGHNGEIRIFGTAVNDCSVGYQLDNTGATQIAAKFEQTSLGDGTCTGGDEGCGTGLLIDNLDNTSPTHTIGNVITFQSSKANVGIQINDSQPSRPPTNQQIIGVAFDSNATADIPPPLRVRVLRSAAPSQRASFPQAWRWPR
ncbi:MAG TPA: glycosyl hydrolase family 28-related protein [Terriglobales bacterium]